MGYTPTINNASHATALQQARRVQTYQTTKTEELLTDRKKDGFVELDRSAASLGQEEVAPGVAHVVLPAGPVGRLLILGILPHIELRRRARPPAVVFWRLAPIPRLGLKLQLSLHALLFLFFKA